jgi:hypothetical protein
MYVYFLLQLADRDDCDAIISNDAVDAVPGAADSRGFV